MTGALDIRRRAEGGISCLAFNAFAGSGTLKGFGDFHVVGWHFRIFGCSAHCQTNSRWVQLPSKPLIDKAGLALREDSGKIRYAPVIAFDHRELLRRFSDAACQALDAYYPGWDGGEA